MKKTSPLVFLLALSLLSGFRPASALPVAVVNAGFEDNSACSPFNEFTFGPPAGWSLYDPGNVTGGGAGNTYFVGTLTPQILDPIGNPGVHEFFPGGAAEGNRVGIAFNYAGSHGSPYGMFQVLSETLQLGVVYTLQVEIGNIASGFAINNTFFDLDGFPGYRVDLLAGTLPDLNAGLGSVLASDNNTLAGSIPEGEFATSTVVFSATPGHANLGQNLAIRLVNLNALDPLHPGSDLEVDFDDVRLDATAVPEPSSAALALAVGAAAALRRNRRS